MRSTSRIAKVDDSQFDVVGRGAVSADRSGAVRSYPVTDLAETRRIDAMIRRNMAAGVQAKLTVGAPNDKYEQEADRVAEQVMGMPAVQREGLPGEEIQTKPLVANVTPLVQREAMPEEEEEIQAKRSSGGELEADGDFESRLGSSKSGGSPLSADVRSFMEPRFGADFSGVRVHTGSDAVQMNQDMSAQAFAHGQDVYFGAGKAPGNDALTAHELTHVVQQSTPQVQQKQSDVQKKGNLPDGVQDKMESAFGADFSDVKVYENSQSAKDLEAAAYTQGDEIHFAPGYQPYSSEGQEYLGHELSHVLQQREGIVKETHVENGNSVSSDESLESKAHEDGRKAASGQVITGNKNQVKQTPTSASVQKKSQPIQMWRDVPGQAQIESTAPDTPQAWAVFMQAARQSVGGHANKAEPELRAVYYDMISQRLRGSFQPINIDSHTIKGFNHHWVGSIRFVFGDTEMPLQGSGTASTTLTGASGSSGSLESSNSNTVGSSGSASGSHAPGAAGGLGGAVAVGGTGSTATGIKDTQGDTQVAGAASQISQQLNRFSSGIGIEVNITASYDMGSDWSDWVNPSAYAAWGAAEAVAGTGNATGACGSVMYFKGAGIAVTRP
jgi:hypothetical protein